MIVIDLPFPNSTNTHWRHARGRTYLSPAGVAFRNAVCVAAGLHNLNAPEGRLFVGVQLFPPDNRVRDIDNFGGKALLDALTHSKIIKDDSLIDCLTIQRMPVIKGGKCRVFISEYTAITNELAGLQP